MSPQKLGAVIVGVAILLAGAAGAWHWLRSQPDPHVARAEALSEQIAQASPDGPPDFSRPEVREQLRELRSEVEAMPEEKRQVFVEGQMNRMQQRMEEQFDRYLAMSPDERTAELDRVIDQMEGMRRMFADRRSERNAGDGEEGMRPPRFARGNRDPAQRNERRREMLDRTTPEFRAKATRFSSDLFRRMEQRGMAPPFRGGGAF